MSKTDTNSIREPGNEIINLKGFDYIEFYVGNALQASHYYRTVFGFKIAGYAGPETGVSDRTSLLVEQGKVRLLLTSAQSATSPIVQHVITHSDSVKNIAFTVEDSAGTFERLVRNGARPVQKPTIYKDDHGYLIKSSVTAFGDTIHSFIQRDKYQGMFFPGFRPVISAPDPSPAGIVAIDHLAVGVEQGMIDHWVGYYNNILGFHQSFEEDTTTEYSAMYTKAVQNKSGRIITVIVEPAPGRRRSPIEEFLIFNIGPGVHHIALLTANIIETVAALRGNGLEFMQTPSAYYDNLQERVGEIDEDISALRDLNILVDRDASGYLMQIFSKPVQTRPTFFFELIQRKGARGFGGGNIKALLEAIEREQVLRGNA
jgi:4-hydroxyphenylpyruvate dioxygenase